MNGVESNVVELSSTISKFFNVVESFRNETFVEYVVISSKGDINTSFNELYDELVTRSYYPILYNAGEVTVLRIINGRRSRTTIFKVPSILFSLTLLSVLITGYFVSRNFYNNLNMLVGSGVSQSSIIYEMVLFTLSVLFPLTMHELGHLIMVKKSNIPASYPVFIPAPFISPLGTFGAIVKMEFLPKNLISLLKLGISGPLFGFITSLTLFIINYLLSPKLPVEAVLTALSEGVLRYVEIVPLSAYFIMNLSRTPSEVGLVTILNPAAYASLIMILIHFINLLPIGQLDGGHVIRGVTSVKTHSMVSIITTLVMVISSLYSAVFFGGTLIWLGVFSVLALIISGFRPHIGAANMLNTSVPRNFKIKVILTYVALLILSMPIPLIG
ncbi:MAG: site-2 protease family protein [Sulfolobales archaeon]